MIVPMKKVHLVVLDSERDSALDGLRRLGVMHVVTKEASSPALSTLGEKKARVENAYSYVRDLEAPKEPKGKAGKGKASAKGNQPVSSVASSLGADPEALTASILSLVEERKRLEESISKDSRELERLAPWGSVDPEALKDLVAAGLTLIPYEFTEKQYAALDKQVKIMVLGRGKKTVRALLVGGEGGELPTLSADCTPLALPELSTTGLATRLEASRARLIELGASLLSLAESKASLLLYIERLDAELEFETAKAGMECLLQGENSPSLLLIEGYGPEPSMDSLLGAAKKGGWAILADEPEQDDAVPTMVDNSPIVRIVQPIFDFLGTVPNYREYDISALFLLFFCFFFGMIFGDAGYGALLMGAGVLGAISAKRAGKPVPTIMRLLMTLAGFTILWGVLTLNYFGIEASKMPAFFRSLDIYWISNANPDSGDNIKVLCFIIATIQLSIAHIKNIKRDFATLKWLGQAGQLLMVVGMINVVFNLVISSSRFPIPTYAFVLLILGFVLNFVFANYEGSIVRSILSSLTNFVSVFLGVVNVFADIVSYIRLWAVGLAGLAISQTVNNMVGPLMGKLSLFLVLAVALAFGHGFNIILSFLSVIVHGVRLNMLEFSVHLGMEWSGFEYSPFKERLENKDNTSKEQL